MEKYTCPNCEAEARSPYCPQCGQCHAPERLSWKVLWDGTMSTFLGDGFNGEAGSVVRYGVLGTLWQILFHPVATVTGFLAGKRRKYFNPIALLLLLSALFALINSLLGINFIDASTFPTMAADSTINSNLETVFAYTNAHPALYVLVQIPFIALVFKWIFRPRKLRYIEFFYVAIFTSFLSLILAFVGTLLRLDATAISTTLLTTLPVLCVETAIYRRIFDRGILRTAVNLLLGYALYMILILSFTLAFMFLGGIIYAISTLA